MAEAGTPECLILASLASAGEALAGGGAVSSILVLDEQGYELLHRRVEQGFSLRSHDAVDLIRLGWLTLVVDQLVAQAPLQAFDASVVERVERHAHW